MTCALWGEVRVGAGRPRAGPPPAHPLADEDAADLAAAHPDALGLGGCGQGVQGPVRRRLGVRGRTQPLAALLQAAGRLRAGQLDDPAALVLADPPGQAQAGQVGQPVQAIGVEAVQPLVDRLGVAARRLGQLGDAGAVPACGDDAGALDQAGRRVPGAGEPAQGAFLGRVGGWSGGQRWPGHVVPLVRPPAARRTRGGQANYTALKERSTSGSLLARVGGTGAAAGRPGPWQAAAGAARAGPLATMPATNAPARPGGSASRAPGAAPPATTPGRRTCSSWWPVVSPRAAPMGAAACGAAGTGWAGGSANQARQQNENAQHTSCQGP